MKCHCFFLFLFFCFFFFLWWKGKVVWGRVGMDVWNGKARSGSGGEEARKKR